MPSPYAPLATFLTSQPATTTTVTLTLDEIAQLLGHTLPAGAWARGWWQRPRESGRLRPWVAAGWRVTRVAMRQVAPTITFARVADGITEQPASPGLPMAERARERRRHDPPMGDKEASAAGPCSVEG
jgi:hypothetical protein